MREFKEQAQKSLANRIKSYGGTPGRAAGGNIHSDVKEDRRLIKSMVEPSALKRAAGGHVKAPKKPHQVVNIAIAPKGDGPAPDSIGAGAAAPVLPPRPAPRPVPAPMPAGNGPAGPGGPAIPVGAKRGGGIKRADGGKVHRRDDGGNVTTARKGVPAYLNGKDEDRLKTQDRLMADNASTFEKNIPSRYLSSTEQRDRELRGGVIGSKSGPATGAPAPYFSKGGTIKRERGGKVHMTAGAANGEGRLQKIAAYGAKAGVRKTK